MRCDTARLNAPLETIYEHENAYSDRTESHFVTRRDTSSITTWHDAQVYSWTSKNAGLAPTSSCVFLPLALPAPFLQLLFCYG